MAITIPIVTEFADKGLKSAEAGFNNFKMKVAEAEGGLNKMKAGFGAATDFMKANAGTFAAVAGAAFVKFGASAINAASDFEESSAKISQIFGDAKDSIMEFADQAAQSLGQSKQDVLDAAGVFGTFGKAAGLAGEDLAGFTTDLTALASDLASFNNTSPEEAIQAIGAALRGESEPLRKYGILLDDASMRAEALKMGIYNGNGALTAQQKILAANSLIFQQSKDAQGDFARTSDGLANQQRILKAELENVTIEMGQKLLPVVLQFVHFANDELVPLLIILADGFSALTSSMKTSRDVADELPSSLKAAGRQFGFFQGLVATAADWLGIYEQKSNDAGEETMNFVDALGASRNALQTARAALRRTADITNEFDRDVNGLIDTWDELLGTLSNTRAFNNVKDSLDNVYEAAGRALEEKTPAAARAAQDAVGDLYGEVADYIQLLGNIPADKQTKILALLDQGKYDEVMRLLEQLTRERTVKINTVQGTTVRPGDTPSESRSRGVNVVGPDGRSYYIPPGLDFSGFGKTTTKAVDLTSGGGSGNRPTVMVNVQGSVTSERDLVETIRRGLVNSQRNGAQLVYSNT